MEKEWERTSGTVHQKEVGGIGHSSVKDIFLVFQQEVFHCLCFTEICGVLLFQAKGVQFEVVGVFCAFLLGFEEKQIFFMYSTFFVSSETSYV